MSRSQTLNSMPRTSVLCRQSSILRPHLLILTLPTRLPKQTQPRQHGTISAVLIVSCGATSQLSSGAARWKPAKLILRNCVKSSTTYSAAVDVEIFNHFLRRKLQK